MENETLTVLEVNAETGEQIERDFTDAELAQREIDQENVKVAAAEAEARSKARASALAKLKKLGLTAAEIEAL